MPTIFHPRAILTALAVTCLFATADQRPNIVYFYADDLGWGTLKANNPDSLFVTPTIDSLVSTGINFTRGYGCMVCSPARSSQQTGFHQGHTWTDRNDPAATKAIRAEDTTIATILRDAGYRTAYYGKWGYGADSTAVDPLINNPQTLPINHGYDELLAELHHSRAHTFFQPTLWRSNTSDPAPTTALVPNMITGGNPLHPNYPAYQDDPTYPTTAYADDTYAIAALDFVRANAQTPQPFFVTLAFQTPHTPLGNITSMPNWFDAYSGVAGSDTWADGSKQFAAMVTRMDAHMSNILDALDDPNNDGDPSDSVRDNTLIIFASDNGGQGGTPYTFFSTNGILSGTKGSVKEGGIRVPTVMNWRGKIAPGQSTDMPTDVTDILPTLAELAGTRAPVGTDGVSIAPTLTGEGTQRHREFLTHESGSSWSIIKGNMKLRNNGDLFDLAMDPGESTDISNSNGTLVAELQAIAAGEFAGADNLVANSFRTWEGSDGSPFEADASWSDPAYPSTHPTLANDFSANTPNSRWNAVMRNITEVDCTTALTTSTQLLALEIGGNTGSGHSQTLTVPRNTTLTGRNEIRISELGIIDLDGGTLDTMRWVDILQGGSLHTGGTVTGSVFNSGSISVSATTEGNGGGEGDTTRREILSNGGFEIGSGTGNRSYPEVDDWITEPGFDTTKTLAKTADARTGSYRAQIHGKATAPNGSAIQETGHSISLNDQFHISFWHQSFSNWESSDKIRVELFFYLDDASQQRTSLFNTTVTPSSGAWNQSTLVPAPVTDTNAIGRKLWILLTPDQASESNTEWAGLDDISLTVDVVTPPNPLTDARSLSIGGDFRQFPGATLDLELGDSGNAGEDYGSLSVSGTAYLDGSLSVTSAAGFSPQIGDSFTIITAAAIEGRFQHAEDMIQLDDHQFRITYAEQTVTLELVATTAMGTPHWWLDGYGLNGGDYEFHDRDDPDRDGIPTSDEYIAGTDPTDGRSALVMSLDPSPGGEPLNLTWLGVANRLYFIESSLNLSGFNQIGGPYLAEQPMNTYSITNLSGSGAFYRLRVELQ